MSNNLTKSSAFICEKLASCNLHTMVTSHVVEMSVSTDTYCSMFTISMKTEQKL